MRPSLASSSIYSPTIFSESVKAWRANNGQNRTAFDLVLDVRAGRSKLNQEYCLYMARIVPPGDSMADADDLSDSFDGESSILERFRCWSVADGAPGEAKPPHNHRYRCR